MPSLGSLLSQDPSGDCFGSGPTGAPPQRRPAVFPTVQVRLALKLAAWRGSTPDCLVRCARAREAGGVRQDRLARRTTRTRMIRVAASAATALTLAASGSAAAEPTKTQPLLAAPATAAGNAGPSLTGAELKAPRLSLTATCSTRLRFRVTTGAAAVAIVRARCRSGRAVGSVRLEREAARAGHIAVQLVGGGRRSMTTLGLPNAHPARAKAASGGVWRSGSAYCERANFLDSHPRQLRIGLLPSDTFGLPDGTPFGWKTWVLELDSTGTYRWYSAPGYAESYAGFNTGGPYIKWYVRPGVIVWPAIEVRGYDWNYVRVDGFFPAPARDVYSCQF